MSSTLALQHERYSFSHTRTYLAALAFIAGNIIVPQLCHLIPRGGLIFLPIYFFTLIATFKCGWKVGLMTAILSPLVNCAFFGMPPVGSLPAILVKSVALVGAGWLFGRKMGLTVWSVLLTVLAYQAVGMLFEFFLDFNLMHALQDVRIGWPGMLIQFLGGYLVLKLIDKW